MDKKEAGLLGNFVAREDCRHRSLSTSVALSGPSVPEYPMRVPIHHLYQSVALPTVAHHVYPASYPSSPSFGKHQPHFPTVASASWPVFPTYAQSSGLPKRGNGSGKQIREATLYSKSQPGTGSSVVAVRKPAVSPKMHLYAGSKNYKSGQDKLKEEEFPVPPAHWLIGASPVESSVSSSEAHSGETSEDESEDCFSESPRFSGSLSSEPHSPVMKCVADGVGVVNKCHVLSENLKVLLKINA